MILQEERAGVEVRVPEAAIRQVLEEDGSGLEPPSPAHAAARSTGAEP